MVLDVTHSGVDLPFPSQAAVSFTAHVKCCSLVQCELELLDPKYEEHVAAGQSVA